MKAKIVICVIAAIILFSGASPWEGAAAVAPEGELPATGRYVATNAFPVNTIVDITNIESSKSTRAIVAKNLNSPGLLAVVSLEAAELIGMRPGSVSRIRMVQPSDPIAYLRFTEGVNADIPDYDSGRVLTEEQLLDELYRADTYRPPSGEETAQVSGTRGPSYTLEPEWSGRRIVDLPGYVEYPLPQIAQTPAGETPISQTPAGETPASQTPAGETPASQTPVSETPGVVAQVPEQRTTSTPVVEGPKTDEQLQQEIIKNIAERIDETPSGEVIKDVPEYITEAARSEAQKNIGEYITEAPVNETEKDISEFLTETPRTDIAKDIPQRIESEPAQARTQTQSGTQSGYVLNPTTDRPPENDTIYNIDFSALFPEVAAARPSQEAARTVVPAADSNFPAFTRYQRHELDRGWYYVQLAAVNSPEAVEIAINQLNRQTEGRFDSYKPVVFRESDNWYRILLGPLNQGESAAVLQRFKSIGFKDAFVRRGS